MCIGSSNLNGEARYDASANTTAKATFLTDEYSDPNFTVWNGSHTSLVVLQLLLLLLHHVPGNRIVWIAFES